MQLVVTAQTGLDLLEYLSSDIRIVPRALVKEKVA